MNASVYLLDLGNSRLKWARVLADGQLGVMHALAYDRKQANFSTFLDELASSPPSEIWLSSVAGYAGEQLCQAITALGFAQPKLARAQAKLGSVQSAYRDADKLGVDRFLSLLAAANCYPAQASLIAIAGTALTIDFLHADGKHLGGLIAPGPTLMRRSLQTNTAQLDVPISTIDTKLGFADNTQDAIALGCQRACASLIVRQVQLAHVQLAQTELAESKPKILLLLSGGAASELSAELQTQLLDLRLDVAMKFVPELVLLGLAQYRALNS